MKNLLLCLSICLALSSCDQFQKSAKTTDTVTYSQLTAEKNYWDSIPGKIKVRDHARPYRYYFNDNPYTGKIEDYFSPGKPKLIGTFKDGFAEGAWKYYQENDSLEQAGSFENGYVTGEWRFYDRKGKEDTRLIYKVKNHLASADTLMVVYSNGLKKEWHKDSIYIYFPQGNIKYRMTADGSAAREWDMKGNMIAETKDYIKFNNVTHETTYYVAQGKHKKAYNDLLNYTKWTNEQKDAFKKANAVTVTASGVLGVRTYGFQVRTE